MTTRPAALTHLLSGAAGRLNHPHWPSILDGLRFRWSAADGIDLTTGIAVPVRAYVESHKLIEKTYTMQAGYPGFDRAVLGPQCANSRTGHDSDLQRP